MAATNLLSTVIGEVEDLDSPDARRRLSDKVLSAFNYAYAIGARDIAERLRGVLAEVEARSGAAAGEGQGGGALHQAELWVAYIEARNRYHATSRGGRDAAKALAALEAMKDAYKRWSFS